MRPRLVLAVLALAAALSAAACGSGGADDSPPTTTATETAARVAPDVPRSAGGKLALRQVGKFEAPVYVAGAPGYPRLLFVVEQPGRIVVLENGRRLPRPFLDIRERVDYEGERGLLSVAFPPDYKASGASYVYYVDRQGSIQIDEYHRASPTRAAAGSRRTVITIPHPVNANHNGGQLQFLGEDLYFGTGDGGAAGDPPNNAQNKEVLLGKLLRIDPRPTVDGKPYSVPGSNPFVGSAGRDEIYGYGLRNPFRFSFDAVTDPDDPPIAIGDVGQNRYEEIDYTPVAAARGANFGWDALEGFSDYEEEDSGTPDPGGTTKPIFAYPHSRDGSCSVIGGYVVADHSLPSLYGRYVYADYCEGRLRVLTPHLHGASDEHQLAPAVPFPTSFGEDDAHHLYVTSQEGPVYRLVQK